MEHNERDNTMMMHMPSVADLGTVPEEEGEDNNNNNSNMWDMVDRMEAARTTGKRHHHDHNGSGTSLTLDTDADSQDEPPSFFTLRCTWKGCIIKTTIVVVLTAIIGGLAVLLEPTYPEIKMNTPNSHELCMKLLNESLSADTMDRIERRYSPQAQALEWMDNDPKLNQYPLWRHRQRFALVTIYYAFNGVLWPEHDKGDWLSYEVSECEWLHQAQVCDDTERLERLVLSDMSHFRGRMPPEIEILTPSELAIVRMTSQSFSLLDLLPHDKATMARLETIDFSHTHLKGTIPRDIGWMFSLQEINFSEGQGLKGTLPTELALLKDLHTLKVQGNQLSGPLPNMSPSLSGAHLQRNQLTGRIPEDWCFLTSGSLTALHLDDNRLEGAVPPCLMDVADFSYQGNPQLIAP